MVDSESFKARIGQITVDDKTIRLVENDGQQILWWPESFPSIHGRTYQPGPTIDSQDFPYLFPDNKPEVFAKVADEVIVAYFAHPVITAWVTYNVQTIVILRSLGLPFSDKRIRQAENHLRAVGGTAAIKAAKRDTKNKNVLVAAKFDELLNDVHPFHKMWWASRKRYRSAPARRSYVLENLFPDDEGIPPAYDEDKAYFRAEKWIEIFESRSCSERKRQIIHLRQAVWTHLERQFPGIDRHKIGCNIRRARKSLTR
jgi:hypothetical protein